MVNLHKLIRMIQQQRPHILAVDNIYELTSSKRDLIFFMRKLPRETRLIQVTGGEQFESLNVLARKHGISFNRFDPIQEAEVCARLASVDVGMEVSVFEDRTFIKVSRTRSLGKGGWSQNRYRRKVHGNVRQKVREIENMLKLLDKQKNIHFSSSILKGFGGYVRGEFLVEAARSQIPLKSEKYGDVQVRVREVERDTIKYLPLSAQKRKYIIVGVDPGTTTGLALLDLEGNLIKLHSSRNTSVSDVIEIISQQGRPIIVAADVSPVPGTVEKIRRTFNAISGELVESLSAVNKINLARPYGYRNDHERDALAAAAYVFKRYKNKFDQIRKRIPQGIDVDECIALVIRGHTIESAIAALTTKDVSQEKKIDEGGIEHRDDKIYELIENIKKYKETINNLKTYQEDLKSRIKKKDRDIADRDEKIRSLKLKNQIQLRKDQQIHFREKRIRQLDKTIREKDQQIKSLIDQIEELKRVRNLEIRGNSIPVKVVPCFTKESLASKKELYGINPGDVLFFKDASGGGPAIVDILADYGVRAVIVRGELAHNAIEEFYKKEIPFFNISSVPVYYVDDFGVVDPKEFKSCEVVFLEELGIMKKKEKEKLLKDLVEEYKSERRRGI
jgi:predicted RNase H-like nuclease (RuvC/YqgF family)